MSSVCWFFIFIYFQISQVKVQTAGKSDTKPQTGCGTESETDHSCDFCVTVDLPDLQIYWRGGSNFIQHLVNERTQCIHVLEQ